MQKRFIQLGKDIIAIDSIIRISIGNGYSGDVLVLCTKELELGPEGEGGCSSWTRHFSLESPEARALMSWMNDYVEFLTVKTAEEV